MESHWRVTVSSLDAMCKARERERENHDFSTYVLVTVKLMFTRLKSHGGGVYSPIPSSKSSIISHFEGEVQPTKG